MRPNTVRVPVITAVAICETCQACGRELTGRADRKYCNSACRQAGRKKRLKGHDPAPEKVPQVSSGRKRVSATDGFIHNVEVIEELERELRFLSCFVVAGVTVRQAEFVRVRLARGRPPLNVSLPDSG
jgi:hypothetical protein